MGLAPEPDASRPLLDSLESVLDLDGRGGEGAASVPARRRCGQGRTGANGPGVDDLEG